MPPSSEPLAQPEPPLTNRAAAHDLLSALDDLAVDEFGDAGMSTAEYAIGTVAACGFAGVLWAVVHSDAVARMLQGVVERALSLAQ